MSDIVERLRGGVDADIGVYPQAVSGYNDERDYEQRDGFKNGWNAAVLQIEGAYEVLLGDAATEIENLRRELDMTENQVRNHKGEAARLARENDYFRALLKREAGSHAEAQEPRSEA